MIQNSYDDTPSLYLVPTPIGNIEDITIRAINVLKSVDIILCEDTRDSSVLLNKYEINKKLVSCHQFNELSVVNKVLSYLADGLNIALITDQGTPIISDPGYVLAREIIKNGFNVISLPGATAFVPALTSSGIEPSPFLFYGFLNSKSSKQKKELESLKNYSFSIIFYESVHRIRETLKNILDTMGDRNICLCRELTKVHEEYIRGKVSEVLDNLNLLKGEFVIIVEGNKNLIDFTDLSIVDHVKMYLDDMSEKEAIKKVALERNVAKSIIYKEYHEGK
ncbi:MAG: 16S rRNA (cytidine(1402)-2'-O)-methyltransferase [Bacilli bacterium]|nr:16S rRNA (cytidine(1402)-2'-O)-methyltransferase [Bacilli bacterium]MBR1936712.1 16S rRNA (cytidine(1402)-2'-O)-methyltransferase [Bacilli bacterium]